MQSQSTRFVTVRLTAVLLLGVVASVLAALVPVALKSIVDGFSQLNRTPSVSSPLLVGLYVLTQWGTRTVDEIRRLVYARAERRVFRTLSEHLFAHVMRLPVRFQVDRQVGAVNQILENGLQGYQVVLQHFAFTLVPVVVQLGTTILVLLHTRHLVFLAFLFVALVSYLVTFAYAASTLSKATEKASAAHVSAHAMMTDSMLNYQAVKYFTAESFVQENVTRALSRAESEWVIVCQRYALNGLGVAMIFAAFLGATILYATYAVESGRMTVGDFVMVNSYMLQIVGPMEMLGYAAQGFAQGIAMLEKMLALFRETPETGLEVTLSAARRTEPATVEFQDVSLCYRPGAPALSGITFRIQAGRTLGIVGASGSGKSTIVQLLVRFSDPDRGRVLIDDIPISELPLSHVRQSIAVVPQDSILFNDTIGRNIGFGKPQATFDDIEQAAKFAHLHEFIMSLPEKYDTLVGEKGIKLSGGEKQRISIARAAIRRPRICIFDEATSSLDSRTEREILKNLREVSHHWTTVVIAHRLSTVVHADEIIVLDAGIVVERGTHASLLRHNGCYAALWTVQQSGPVAA